MSVQAPSNLFVEVLLGFLPVAYMQGQGSGGWGGGSWGVGWQGPAQGGKGGPHVAVILNMQPYMDLCYVVKGCRVLLLVACNPSTVLVMCGCVYCQMSAMLRLTLEPPWTPSFMAFKGKWKVSTSRSAHC